MHERCLAPWEITVEAAEAKSFEFFWLDEEGQPMKPAIRVRGPRHRVPSSPVAPVPDKKLAYSRNPSH